MVLDSARHFGDRIEGSDHRLLPRIGQQQRDDSVSARILAVWRIKV